MSDPISRIEAHFHALIRKRAGKLATELGLPTLPRDVHTFEEQWFPVPGMSGGFAYALHDEPDGLVLITESWSRVVGRSGQRHRITPEGCELLEEGFA